MNSAPYHVAIVGGGLAGLSLACLLGQAGVSTACIDQAPPGVSADHDLRTTAVSFGSQKILDAAGVWRHLSGKTCAIDNIRILDGGSSMLLNFLSSEVENKSFGWIVENADLRAALMKTFQSCESLAHIAPAKVRDFRVDENSAAVILEDDSVISAQLVIGADGRNSFTRQWMGVRTRGWSYGQRAVICTAAHENPHHNAAVEHFFPEGPFAVLPMQDATDGTHRSSVVFTEHGPEEKSLMRLDDAAFEKILAEKFPADYGEIALIGKRACYPLGLVHAAHYIAPRMALVADAAHGIHPIAGQGLNLGFRDVKELAALIARARERGEDVGAPDLLETYQRRRRPDNMAMVAMTDGLNRLFSNDIPPVRALRRAGLKMVARLAPAKKFFMRQAMGGR
jgi:2-octaprenyl-6-methoxyphenol hydroxylase